VTSNEQLAACLGFGGDFIFLVFASINKDSIQASVQVWTAAGIDLVGMVEESS
jgi:hypothetical protein